MRRLMLCVLALAASFAASAQTANYLTITTTNPIVDASGTAMPSGTFCAYATDATDSPIAFSIGGSIQAVKSTVCRPIANGVLSSSLQLANPAATQPNGIRYHITTTNTKTGQVTQYPAVTISVASGTTTWDWGSWNPAIGVPSIPTNIIVGQAATVAVGSTTTGAAGSSAAVTNSGTSSAAVLNFTVPQGASGVGTDPNCHTDSSGHLTPCISVSAGTTTPTIIGNTGVTFPDGTLQSTARPTAMPRWSTALQNVINGGNGTPMHARVLWIGDSTYLGVSATIATSVPANFCNDTQAYYGVRCEWNSWFGGSSGQSFTFGASDPRIVMGSAWTFDTGIQSIGGDAYTATTATNSFAFTPTTAVDTFEVYYVQQPGNGVLSVQIDGGTATTINTAGTAALKKVTISAGSLGTHTISHTWSSGGKVDLVGNVAYDSTASSVIVLMAGWSGVTSGGLSGNSAAYNTGNSAALGVVAPDLTLVEDGINDWANPANLVATFKTNMQTVITALEAAGSDVVLNSPIPSKTTCTTQALQTSYVEAYRNLATLNHNAGSTSALPFVDTYTAWGTATATSALFWRGGDCWHGSSLGYSAVAVLIESAVLGAPAHPFAMNIGPYAAAIPAQVISKHPVQLVGGTYTIIGNEGTIWATSAPTITFPTGLPWGFQVDVNGAATLSPGAGSGIFNTTLKVASGGSVTLQTNGTYWYAIASNGGNYVTDADQSSNYTSNGGERLITLHSGAGVTLTAATGTAMMTVVNTSSSLSSAISYSGTAGFGIPSTLPPQTGITICYTNFWWICGTSASLTPALPAIRAGTWSISAATSVAVTFSTAMGSAPTSCAVMPTASSATTGQPYPTSLAATGFTVNVPTSGTISGTYQCVVNNAN